VTRSGSLSRDPATHYRTQALGTTAEMLVAASPALAPAVAILHAELDRIDRVASRFRSDSEISLLHAGGDGAVPVSADLLEAVGVALRMAFATDGAVDPTVGGALCRLGYDRDFAAIADGVPGALPPAEPIPGWRSITVDAVNGTIRLPPGTLVDLGATAKALAADRAAAAVHAALGCGVLVSLGGDIAVAGPPPPGGFRVGLADACTSVDVDEVVAVSSGGLASSGVMVRSWRLGDQLVHHIIDPATGLPVAPVWRTVSVAAATCVEANAAATAAMVKGANALAWLFSFGLPARLVGVDGLVWRIAGWPADDESPALDVAS